MLSVAMGYFCQPPFKQAFDTANAVQFSILTGLFLVLGALFFALAKFEPAAAPAMPGA